MHRRCLICRSPLGSQEQKICGACLVQLPFIRRYDFYDNLSCRLLWGRMRVERAFSCMAYRHDDFSHQLLIKLKYDHHPELGRWLGCMMARDLLLQGFFNEIDAIVPIPLHWLRKLRRGYNQSRELALGISKATGLPVLSGVVRRVRNNPSQTTQTASQRMENVANVFQARSGLTYRHILLVDDVLTTGATMSACAQAICELNPDVRISVFTLARAID